MLRRFALFLLGGISILAAASAAFADEAPVVVASNTATDLAADGLAGVETVTVRARFREEKVQDVPIAVTALSGEHLNETGVSQIQQLAFDVPNLSIVTPNPQQTAFAIRGLGNNVSSNGLNASVGLYIDGIYLDRPGQANFDVFDIEQVEVLRGPQGTLFGKNTTAGAVSFTTKAPEFDFHIRGAASIGDYGLQQYQVGVTGPLSDHWAYRITGYASYREGYLRSLSTGQSLLGLDRQGFRTQLLYKPNDNLTWRIIAELDHEDDSTGSFELYSKGPSASANAKFVSFDKWAGNLGLTPVFDPGSLKNNQNGIQRQFEHNYAGTSLLDWNLDGYTLTSVTGYRYWSFLPRNDFDWTSADVIKNSGGFTADRQWSQEFRLASPTGGSFDYIVGAYYFWRHTHGHNFTDYGSQYSLGLGSTAAAKLLDNGETHAYTEISTTSVAAFGQGVWHFAPKWDLTVGFRETYEAADETIDRKPFVSPTNAAPANLFAYTGYVSTLKWTPSALTTLSYKPTESILAYVTASYGAKGGGVNTGVPQSTSGAVLPASSLRIDPEEAVNFEVGLKSQLFDNKLTLNLDAYWTDVFGYQANGVFQDPNNATLKQSKITNVGAVRIRGVELEAVAVPIEGLRLNGSVGYNNAYYRKFLNAPAVQGDVNTTQDLSGRPLVQAPVWSLSYGANYTVPLAAGIDGYIAADGGYKSSSYGYLDDSNYSRLKDYVIANFRLGATFDEGRYDIQAWVKNTTNSRYYFMIYPSSTGSGGYWGIPAEPRTAGVTLRATY